MVRAVRVILSLVLAAAGLAGLPVAEARAVPDNGLARTPPMGFDNWNTTGCGPEFNETTLRQIADLFVSEGLRTAGYQYVNLDDCWALPRRNAAGDLVPDPARFPSGIKALADYVHHRGLKFGIYTSAGTMTCAPGGFPGALDHEERDARQFASWGVDYLKYDNCNTQGRDAIQRYARMSDALRATGRPIVLAVCEWGTTQPYRWARGVGNLWRTTGDIADSWAAVLSIIRQNSALFPYAEPGSWNDPDMLEVGNGGLTGTEARTHFALWAMMAAPLLIGSDLRRATPETLDILTNRDLIAIDQDPLGRQAAVVRNVDGRWVFSKPMAGGTHAVALFNENQVPQVISISAAAAGLTGPGPYQLRDVWTGATTTTTGMITATVPPHGTVVYRISRT
jgi:alpha-galactosidase